MEVTFDVNKLDGMKRPELQKLCKEAGIKANMKVSYLDDLQTSFCCFKARHYNFLGEDRKFACAVLLENFSPQHQVNY